MATSDTTKHKGTCFCGTVAVTATGVPSTMGYCHCKTCRAWSAAPVIAVTLWQSDAVEITQGAEFLASYSKTGFCHRKHCTKCGGHILAEIPDAGITDIFAAILPSLSFEPTLHVNYESAVLKIKDGLPKLKDFPAEVGGSGEILPE